jgi:hypothetical protein
MAVGFENGSVIRLPSAIDVQTQSACTYLKNATGFHPSRNHSGEESQADSSQELDDENRMRGELSKDVLPPSPIAWRRREDRPSRSSVPCGERFGPVEGELEEQLDVERN